MKVVVVTGSAGAIGSAMADAFAAAGYQVIGLDAASTGRQSVQHQIQVDLEQFVLDRSFRIETCEKIRGVLGSGGISALINNAAIQRVGAFEALTVEDWQTTLNINLLAPALLVKEFLPELSVCRGSVINISSIHAKLTKPHFAAYAASKSALLGLTSALAVELGHRIQVMAICPAAIETPMLHAGFKGRAEAYQRLQDFHPCECVGKPEEVARFALSMVESVGPFSNGMVINLDGGIGSRLHDPD